jgi:hypothetical protein
MLNDDYRDMLSCLRDEKVEFLLVGAYAMSAHGYVRATLDIDIWVRPSEENAPAVMRALKRFGAPVSAVTTADFVRGDTVVQIGVPPRRIDIITGATGLKFEETMAGAVEVDIDGIQVRVPSLRDLIVNKRAAGRTKDLADAEAMEAIVRGRPARRKSR